ncbi:PmoA family protein [Terriglobus saanensis]|uniref:Methane oxygenase PmoA n=1 Tax=Terriglobus saanensis (strain ATCC BAA-1853 / DSM 23119 / SP1PR4) TaxID=401053 RepID=E8V7Z1_TERSS|nr:PmoA family protein [Terriglobus saanensis]ADV82915.1 hypothetical protein AciPR4_2112 [Terriglobus saanensis SP1PR4]
MHRKVHRWIVFTLLTLGPVSLFAADKKASLGVQVTPNEAQRRVDVTIDGKPFTSYVWPTSLKKPVLYPLIAEGDIEVTRGYPLAPREGERQDHPHHAGMWFNYGNVNGFDFWNNSNAIPAENRTKMGTIEQKQIVSTKSGSDRGDLIVESTWITGKGESILQQTTHYIFMRHGDARMIDETVTLHALNKAVFHDDKEGLLGIRVARWLESADEKGGIFTDANGKQTKVEGYTGAGATGVYTTSEGKTGDAAWATRGRWCMLVGHNATGQNITVAILDHPSNPNAPTFWHARGYGLFAANPLGRHIFDPKAAPLDFTIEKGQSAVYRHRVLLLTHAATATEMNKSADNFAQIQK